MKILGIETSCDETAICLIETDESGKAGEGFRVLGDNVHSQIDAHKEYGGVFPMLAKREHEKNLPIVLEKTLRDAGARMEDVDLIALTVGPGLEPALWTGIVFAQDLAKKFGKRIVPCNHMEGHILTALIRKKEGEGKNNAYAFAAASYPALSLLISGGHTQIVLVDKPGSYCIVGETLDDAVGECFDKTARILGLEYPGGPKISKFAAEARTKGLKLETPLPRPMAASKDLNFSFSGLKTAVLYAAQKEQAQSQPLSPERIQAYAREIEDSITDVIVKKMRAAIEQYGAQSLIIGGGVIANPHIRAALESLAADCSTAILLPKVSHSTDNGLMIALAGYFNRAKAQDPNAPLKAAGTLPIGPRA